MDIRQIPGQLEVMMSKADNEKQYAIFLKYNREYLAQATGYSKGYLSRIASGAQVPSEVFIGVCCHNLKESQDDLFRLLEPHKESRVRPHHQDLPQALLETIDELTRRLTQAEKDIKALQDEIKQYR